MGSWGRWGGRLNSCVREAESARDSRRQRFRGVAHFEEIGEASGGEVDVGVRGVFGLVGGLVECSEWEWRLWVVPLWAEVLTAGRMVAMFLWRPLFAIRVSDIDI